MPCNAKENLNRNVSYVRSLSLTWCQNVRLESLTWMKSDIAPLVSCMAEVITCPSCQRSLQVPEQFLGQLVQCPECRHQFIASSTAVSAKPAPVETPVPATSRRRYEEDEPEPAAKRKRYDDDDTEEVGTRRRRRYDEDIDDDIDVRRSRGVGREFNTHRGGVILALGLVSLVGGMSMILPIVLGPVAWAMGTYDLREIREGRMDPAGESMTRTGQVLGIISTLFMIFGGGLMFLMCAGGIH